MAKSGVQLDVSCQQLDYLPFRKAHDHPHVFPSVLGTSGPFLFLSNSPEAILAAADLPLNLYRCAIPLGMSAQPIRCYIWHKNKRAGETINIGLIASLAIGSGPAVLSNFRVEKNVTSDLVTMGICTAKAQLYGSYDAVFGTIPVVTDVVITSAAAAVPPEQTFGCVIEFNAAATTLIPTTLQLRTAAYTGPLGAVPNQWTSQIATIERAHPRGHWQAANAMFSGGTFNASPYVPPQFVQLRCCDKGKAEEATFGDDPLNSEDSVNRGLYGVNLTYRFNVTNAGNPNPSSVWAFLKAVNTDETYFGASKVSAPGSNPDRGVPEIAHLPATAPNNFVNLTAVAPVVVPAYGSVNLDVIVANAGASTMPYEIVLSKINLEIEE
ncbi:MAG: hypothetical protein ACR2HJ_05230 [Fimbriimonadales bacterium]